MKNTILPFGFFALVLAGCTPKVDLPEIQSGSANFNKYIAIGDDYMSGYQDGALFMDAQSRSIGALIFESLRQAGSMSFNQAKMPDNTGLGIASKHWEGTYVTASHLNYRVDCEGVSSLGPVKTYHTSGTAQPYLDPLIVSSLDDITVPYATVEEFVSPALYLNNVFYNRIAGNFSNASALQVAINRQPTFFSAWLGMENVFRYARNGGFGQSLLSPAQFSSYLDSILSPLNASGSKGIIATIPDFRNFPFYTLIPWNGAHLEQEDADSLTQLYLVSGFSHISFSPGDNPFIIDDPAAPSGFRQLVNDEYILLTVPLDSMKCNYYGIMFSTIHDRYILDSSEVAQLDDVITQYNSIIRAKAALYGLAVMESEYVFDNLNTGMMWNGVEFTPEFVRGGFFSLDGYHPTQKGAALLANEFIRTINSYFGSTLPTILCPDCNGVLFP